MLPDITRILASAVVVAAIIPTTAAGVERTIWTSPLGAIVGDSRMAVAPGIPLSSIRVTSTTAGDLQWVCFGLTVPEEAQIVGVRLCYELADSRSFISQTRITLLTTPDFDLAVYDDPTDHTDPGPTCYYSTAAPVFVEGTCTLELRLNFASPDHWIDIGAIGIVIDDPTIAAPDVALSESGMRLEQNVPNPFNPQTSIRYAVTAEDWIRVDIHDVQGRLVRTLVDDLQQPAQYHVSWDGTDDGGSPLASGTYYYTVRIGNEQASRKMVMLK